MCKQNDKVILLTHSNRYFRDKFHRTVLKNNHELSFQAFRIKKKRRCGIPMDNNITSFHCTAFINEQNLIRIIRLRKKPAMEKMNKFKRKTKINYER